MIMVHTYTLPQKDQTENSATVYLPYFIVYVTTALYLRLQYYLRDCRAIYMMQCCIHDYSAILQVVITLCVGRRISDMAN